VLRFSLIALCAVLLAACEPPQKIVHTPEPLLRPIVTGSQTRALAFERLSLAPGAVARGAIMGGLACITHGQPDLNLGRADEHERIFAEVVTLAGYTLANDPGSAAGLFGQRGGADYRVGGLVSDFRINVCYPMAGFGDGTNGHGEASIDVEWQVFSAAEDKVVHSVRARGSAKVASTIPRPTTELVRQAFTNAVRELIADDTFRTLMTAPAPAARPKRS
jgi:serine protease Do